MDTISLQTKIYLCAAIIACMPLFATENQSTKIDQKKVKKNNSVVWYKKRSAHIAAATTIIAVVILYALAVHKNKVLGPIAFLTTLFGAQKSLDVVKDTTKPENKTSTSDIQPIINEKKEKKEDAIIVEIEKNPPIAMQPEETNETQDDGTPVKTDEKKEVTSKDLNMNQLNADASDNANPLEPQKNELQQATLPTKTVLFKAFDGVIQKVFGNNNTEKTPSVLEVHENVGFSQASEDDDIPQYR